jgi:hypothetical protein
MLVTAATGSTEFPIGRNERSFVAIWTLIRNRGPPSYPMNNEIASVRVQLPLCNARDLSVERLSRRGSGSTQLV